MKIKTVSVIGLGKLGLPLATCFASKGLHVIGVDKNKNLVDALENGKVPFFEPGLKQMIRSHRKKLSFTIDFKRAVEETDATFIIVPTPSKASGEFTSKFLESALSELALELKRSNKKYHLFVINSTVMPKTVDDVLIPLISKLSGKKISEDFDVCYNPEFIALGNVIENLLNPDIVLIGESSEKAGKTLRDLYIRSVDNKPHIERMSIISAEIMKISLNVYVTMKISFANQLAQICQHIPDADIDAITQALGGDRRIGSKYLKAGTSYGGPCFPRDNRAFTVFAKKIGQPALLSTATDKINDLQRNNLLSVVKRHVKKAGSVLILGAAYKDKTGVIEESASVELIHGLRNSKIKICVYDPLAQEDLKKEFSNKIKFIEIVDESVLDSVSVCVITLATKEYKSIVENHHFKNKVVVIDCWRKVDPAKLSSNVTYIPFGKFWPKTKLDERKK